MRSKDSALMERISDFVGDYYRMRYTSPTVRTIAEALDISKSTAHSYLVEMGKRGLLSYEDGTISNLEKIRKTKTGLFSAPLVGSIRCGDPETEVEQVEMYISLPEAIFGTGEFYLLRAVGDSMEEAGISDGDLVLIRKQDTCEKGDIVVAMDENRENTLKVYDGINKENKKAILRYANEEKYPGKKIEVTELIVQGVARHVIKAL
mgnify:CR=1 FL=1